MSLFIPGKKYKRADIHSKYGGQQRGGCSTPQNFPLILLFTGESGKAYGYDDGWNQEGVFLFYGEGQVGDMEFVRANSSIASHLENHKDIFLFKKVEKAHYRCLGQMICTGYQYKQSPDVSGELRRAIVFELTPIEALETEISEDISIATLSELRKLALAASTANTTLKSRISLNRQRSQAIKTYALRRADGKCEGCFCSAPFFTTKGAPYLEVHHIYRLSDGGPDSPDAVVAICPNCHRQAHYARDAKEFNEHLICVAKQKEIIWI